ncbi:hypothetical protein ACOME3_010220 [Neoechinorhynchus agilis]
MDDVHRSSYICGFCNKPLFTSTELNEHTVQCSKPSITRNDEFGIYTELLDWMMDKTLSGESYFLPKGKIQCPQCHVKLGRYSNIGLRCECGQWVAPSYRFTLKKLIQINN